MFNKVCPWGDWCDAITGLDNRPQQIIILTIDDSVQRRMYVVLRADDWTFETLTAHNIDCIIPQDWF